MKVPLIILSLAGFSSAFLGYDTDPTKSPPLPKDLQFGDMELTDAQKQAVKNGDDVGVSSASYAGSNKASHRWPNAVIPFEIDCSLENMPSALRAISEAMAEWEAKTCIRFVKWTKEKDYLRFFRNTHCWGNVGRIGGRAQISVGDGCDYKHVMVHEIGHVVGFWHEQNRKDRDQWIHIYWNNIQDWVKDAFDKVKDSDSYGQPYDYGSIMHYPWNAFTKNGKDTIKPKRKVTRQPYISLSPGDAKQTSIMYNCPAIRKRRAAIDSKLESEDSSYSAGGCSNLRSACDAWAKAGHCGTSITVVKLCPVSCKVPRCDTSIPCVDAFADCPKWFSWGHCNSNPTVALKCAKSCSPRCKGAATVKPPTRRPVTQSPTQPPTFTVRPNTGGGTKLGKGILCVDSYDDCPIWAKRGHCKTRADWMGRNCMKTCKATGCDLTPLKPPGSCANPIGIGFDGKGWKIPDSAFYSTSHLSPGGGWAADGKNARLYFKDDHNRKRIGAWCAKSYKDMPNAYLQIDLQRRRKLTYIATQGRDRYFERVSEYKIAYSSDGRNFNAYKENGRERIFGGNCDHFTPILNRFNNPIYARHIRYIPVKANYPCVRLELYGC